MSTNNFKSFAVAGIANTVGVPTIKHLLERGVSVIVLTRPGSTKALPEGVKVIPVDYSDVNAVTAVLKEHSVDVFISTIGGGGFATQIPLADAAKAAAVKLFVPSEFGVPTEGAKEGLWGIKNQVAIHLNSIGLPSLRLYTGAFIEWIPWAAAIQETGKFFFICKGDTPISYCGLDDIGAYLAYILTTVPPAQLNDTEIRIEGYRATWREIAALYEGKVPIEPAESIPSHVPMADFRMLVQRAFDTGMGSTGWDPVACKESYDPKAGNKLYPDFKWKTVKEILDL
ncbi:NAD(P)-binding protein [Gyrodon lividus]|nr:NAD(P)-binding protein [Gyrodon lividus]